MRWLTSTPVSARACNLRDAGRHEGGVSDIDGAPFREWAASARPRLRRTAFLLCGDWHLAEDLTQETLVGVYSVWRRVSASGPPDAYATRTLVNARRTQLRRPWRRESVVEVVPDRATTDRATPGGPGIEDRDRLLAALAELGASQRAVVVLRYWEDRSVEEVADVLGLSTGTVKSQAARGLTRLRRLLGEESDEPSVGSLPTDRDPCPIGDAS